MTRPPERIRLERLLDEAREAFVVGKIVVGLGREAEPGGAADEADRRVGAESEEAVAHGGGVGDAGEADKAHGA